MEAHESVARVLDASYARLVAQLLVVCGNQTEAEDAAQEAFVDALGQGSTWAGVEKPEAWLRTVAVNSLRTRWRRGQLLARLIPQIPGPTRTLEATPDRVPVETALARLQPDLRRVVALHYLADLPVAAIADELRLPVGTVKSGHPGPPERGSCDVAGGFGLHGIEGSSNHVGDGLTFSANWLDTDGLMRSHPLVENRPSDVLLADGGRSGEMRFYERPMGGTSPADRTLLHTSTDRGVTWDPPGAHRASRAGPPRRGARSELAVLAARPQGLTRGDDDPRRSRDLGRSGGAQGTARLG